MEHTHVSNTPKPWGFETKQFCMMMHLAQLIGFSVPILGLVVPVIMWAANREEHPEVDAHGKEIINWQISCFIYAVVSTILAFLIIGFGLLAVLFIVCIVFPIIGGVTANSGRYYRYPLNIRFIG